MAAEKIEAPAPSPAAQALGITQDAFDAAGGALKEIVEGGIVGDDPKPEVKPEAKPAPGTPGAPQGPASVAWAKVIEREQALRTERQKIAEEREQWKRERDAEKGKAPPVDIREALRKDPASFEKLMGFPLKDFLDSVLTGTPPPSAAAATQNDAISKLVEKIDGLEKRLVQRDAQEGERSYQSTLSTALKDPKFELLATMPNAMQEMLNFSKGYYQKYGAEAWRQLTPEKIASTLQDVYQEHLRTSLSSSAVRKALGLPEEKASGDDPPEETPKPQASRQPTKPRTVTPSMASSPARGASEGDGNKRKRPPTDDELVRDAAKLVPQDVWDQDF